MSKSNTLAGKFEDRFKQDWLKMENATIDRLYDPVGGMKGISNISDFIGYVEPNIYYLECKTHAGASIPFSCISQYDKLIKKIGIPGVRAGVVVWLYEKEDFVVYIPIATIKQMKEDGEKSFGLRHLNSKYRYIKIPSVKLTKYYSSDYNILRSELKDGD